ncbi:MAG: hypothetical protein QOI45_1243 [Thermoleophilaceae bacterium]|jgi:hypothetical protein|nr:hypothetical protein [Thermoleophilaceae bacterium]
MRLHRLCPVAVVALMLLPAIAAAKPAQDVDVQLLRDGTDRLGGAVDTDALEAYLAPSLTGAPIGPPALARIDLTP